MTLSLHGSSVGSFPRTPPRRAGLSTAVALLGALTGSLVPTHGFGARGVLDPSFGTGGYTLADVDGEGHFAAVLQADGKLISVGNLNLSPNRRLATVRYLPDGGLDPSYGSGGVAILGPEVDDPQPQDAVLLADGKLMVASFVRLGPSSATTALIRLQPDGSLDTGFGVGGVVLSTVASLRALALLPDGMLLAGGNIPGGPGNSADFSVIRYLVDGTIDTSFGVGGVATAHLTNFDLVSDLLVETDGGIVAVGQTTLGSFQSAFGIARWLADGTPDIAFGAGGTLLQPIVTGNFDYPRDIVGLPGGGRVIAGFSANASLSDHAIAVLDSAGVPSPGFSGDGIATPDFGAADNGYSIVAEPDGGLVMAGLSAVVEGGGPGLNDDLRGVLFRLRPNGALDPGFGTAGLAVLDVPGQYNGWYSDLFRLSDGRLLVAGGVNPLEGGSQFVVARYLNGTCGNSVLEPGEDCDDGNTLNGDCCSSTCDFETAGAACADDGLRCTRDECDGAGACGHPLAIRSSCRLPTEPGAARLRIHDRANPRGDRLGWRWTRGAAVGVGELLEPGVPAPYTLCGFDPTANTLVFEATAPGGVTCSGQPCWSFTPTFAVRYRQPDGSPDGIVDLKLTPGVAGRARASVTARGARLNVPTLPLPGSLLVQLQAGGGICMAASYSAAGVKQNGLGRYEARSD